MNTKSDLRIALKARRRALSAAERLRAAQAVARHIAATHWLAPGRRIGLYSSLPDELDTAPLLTLARTRGCRIFLPRILSLRARRMAFLPWDAPGDPHEFGMYEPGGAAFFPLRFLDTLFVPSVALDVYGARLGHGGGFYDRALAFRRTRTHWRGPRLVGLGYAFQIVPALPRVPTDVMMDVLATDKGIHELLVDEDRADDLRHR